MEKSTCPKCSGNGNYIDHHWNDPSYQPSFKHPNFVLCDVCKGDGKRPNNLPETVTHKNYF